MFHCEIKSSYNTILSHLKLTLRKTFDCLPHKFIILIIIEVVSKETCEWAWSLIEIKSNMELIVCFHWLYSLT